MLPCYTYWKIPESQRFFGDFRGYKMGAMTRNELKQQQQTFTATTLKRKKICDALRDLILFVQLKKHGKHPKWSVTVRKVEG